MWRRDRASAYLADRGALRQLIRAVAFASVLEIQPRHLAVIARRVAHVAVCQVAGRAPPLRQPSCSRPLLTNQRVATSER